MTIIISTESWEEKLTKVENKKIKIINIQPPLNTNLDINYIKKNRFALIA
jgi:hypothetical protein